MQHFKQGLAIILAALGVSAQNVPVPGGKYVISQVESVSLSVKPGFTALPAELPGQLVFTSFDPTPFVGKNGVYMASVGEGKEVGPVEKLPGTDGINWPNSITGVKSSVFGFPAIVVGNGFLVPSHTTGGVYVMEASPSATHLKAPVKVTKDKAESLPDSGWFYHQAHVIDMDGDGLDDLVTARCQYGVWPWSKRRGELLWLKQPGSEPLSGQAWEENHLAEGPDFLFCVHPNTPRLALVAPEFIGSRMVYWYVQPDGSMASRVLDEASGPGFSCSWEDLNGDGRLELLATNHMAANGSVFAYSFDGDDVAVASVIRHQLATGFTPSKVAAGMASPGDALAFIPNKAETGKPFIFVSGDNSNSIFLLVPESEDPDNWSYNTQELAKLDADIGRPSVGDTDGDGFADIYVPAYDKKQILHYKVQNAPTERSEVIV